MKKNKSAESYRKIFSALILTALFSLPLNAENIRGEVAGIALSGGESISFKPENIVIVEAGEIPEFQEGMELRIDIPEALNRFQHGFALLIFRNITPAPDTDNRSYSGTRVYMRLLPSRTSAFIRIPFTENHSISSDALTDVLPLPVGLDQFPLLVTVLPVMKGVPDYAFQENLGISVVPLWKDEGSMTVSVANPSGIPEEVIDITVDGEKVTPDEEIIVPAGIHRVRISSTHAPTVEKTIVIEPGQVKELSLPLDYRPPELTIRIPEGAQILLDGEAVQTEENLAIVETTPGDHIITYSLGNLEVNRHFTVRPGGKVIIDLVIAIEITDVGEGSGSEYGAGNG